MKRVVISVIGSLFSVFIVVLILGIFSLIFTGRWDLSLTLNFAYREALIATIISSVIILIWALPMHFWLQKKNKNNISSYALVGFTPGLLMTIAYTVFTKNISFSLFVGGALNLGLMGLVPAIVFYFLYNRNYA